MKKSLFISSIIILICMFYVPTYASSISDGFDVDVKTEMEIINVIEDSSDSSGKNDSSDSDDKENVDYVKAVEAVKDKTTGDLVVRMDDGVIIRAKGRFSDTIRLMVMPIKKNINQEWNWLQSITKATGTNKSAYDIFFVNEKGKRVEAGTGCEISVISNVKTQNVHVYYVTSKGAKKELKSFIEDYVVKFNMVKNGFYTLTVKDKDKDVEHGLQKDEEGVTDKNKDNDDDDDDGKSDDKSSDSDKSDNKSEDENGDKSEEDGNKSNTDDEDADEEDADNEDTRDDSDDDESDDDDFDYEDLLTGSGDDEQTQEEGIDWIFIIVIVFVLIVVGLIFILILRKKKKEEEEDNK